MNRHSKRLALGSLAVGVLLNLLNLAIPQDGTARILAAAYYIIGVPVAFAFLCRPLRSYRDVVLVTAVGSVCAKSLDLIRWNIVYAYFSHFVWLIEVAGLWVFTFLVLSAVVFVRRRWWPVFPAGHCPKCGYNLTGNTSGVCPECGVEVQA